MRRLVLGAIAGGLAVVAATTLAAYWYERPTSVRVAVSRDSEEHRLLVAAQQVLSRDHENVRFRIVPQDNTPASAAALDDGNVDFAVVRSDINMPKTGQTALILHRSAVVLLAPAGSDIRSSTDLNARRIGVVWPRPGAPANLRLLDTILGRYEAASDNTIKVPLTASEVASAFVDKRIDAVLVVGPPQSDLVSEIVNAVAGAGAGAPVFVPISEAKAIAQSSPVFERLEIPRGSFGGAIPRPDHDVETISVSTRLVARSTVADATVGNVTRLLFSKRPAIAATVPLANRMEAPPTDRSAALPVHPGAVAYLDGEEETFLEKYSDLFYIGAMVVSVLASAAAALASRMSASSHARVEDLLGRLIVLLAATRKATSSQQLDDFETEADAILIEALQASSLAALDANRATAFALGLDQVRYAIRDRRRFLNAMPSRLPFEPPRIAAVE